MSNSIRRRTESEVVDYIKNHSQDGKLTESLMEIAENLGYSNATIHRVLKSLEESGVVDIIPADKPTRPNTIVYNGPVKEAGDIIAQGKGLLQKLGVFNAEVSEYIIESNRIITKLQNVGPDDISKYIVDQTQLPDGQHYLLMVKKEGVEHLLTDDSEELSDEAPDLVPSHI